VAWSVTAARPSQAATFAVLAAGLAALALAGLALGPVALSPGEIAAVLTGRADPMAAAILAEIRAPRVALGVLVGVTLALAGTALQGLLRNPLADPGLIGVTAGASLGAVFVIVLGAGLEGGLPRALRPYLLPISAFLSAGVVTALVFGIARRAHGTSVATLILAGAAINAIAGAGIGGMVYVSDDQQLRDLTFWSMGSLGGVGWVAVALTAVLAGAACLALARLARPLDLFQIGERAARHAGLDTERVKLGAGILIALGVGTVTATAGPIGFIGLVAELCLNLGDAA
jgi:iron complex transport system permease protein